MKSAAATQPVSPEFEKFRELTRKLIAVPKREIDQVATKQAAEKKSRKNETDRK
jgi:hypothetical protein